MANNGYVSSSVMAVEVAKYVVPDFSIMIGSKQYTLDYANDKKKESEITKAVIENVAYIYIKTTGSEWLNNSTGKVVTPSVVGKLEVKSFKVVAVATQPASIGESSINSTLNNYSPVISLSRFEDGQVLF